jgi:hypothetical protein
MKLLDSAYYLAHPDLFTWLILAVCILAVTAVAVGLVAIDRRRNRRNAALPKPEAKDAYQL